MERRLSEGLEIDENTIKKMEDMSYAASMNPGIWSFRKGVVGDLTGDWRVSAVQ